MQESRKEFGDQKTSKEVNECESRLGTESSISPSAPLQFEILDRFWNPGFRIRQALVFLICLTTSSKSGHSPVASLEWSVLPLAVTSNAPPLDGTRVRAPIRSPSSRILVAKLTAFGV